MNQYDLSIVIPCYCSGRVLETVIEDLLSVIQQRNLTYEILLVNDGSPDQGKTIEIIKHIIQKHENIVGLNLAKNFGQHSALMAGLRASSGDIVVCMDDDGQTPPKELGKLLDAIDDNCDVVYAKYAEKKHSKFRNFGTWMNLVMCKYLLGKPDDLFITSYFAVKKFVVDEVIKYDNPYPYLEGLILRVTKKIKNVEMEHYARQEGESGYNLSKLLNLWFNGFTSFSVLPLRLASFIGLFFAFLGFVFMVYSIINHLIYENQPSGWTSMMCILLIIGGILMLMLGMIGEYIGRIYISINNSPQYVIRDVYTKDTLK